MEFTINDASDIAAMSEAYVRIPSYVVPLPADELVRALRAEDERIIAAGRHGPSGDVVLLTNRGRLLELKASAGVRAVAIDEGRYLHLEGCDTLPVAMALGAARRLADLGPLRLQEPPVPPTYGDAADEDGGAQGTARAPAGVRR